MTVEARHADGAPPAGSDASPATGDPRCGSRTHLSSFFQRSAIPDVRARARPRPRGRPAARRRSGAHGSGSRPPRASGAARGSRATASAVTHISAYAICQSRKFETRMLPARADDQVGIRHRRCRGPPQIVFADVRRASISPRRDAPGDPARGIARSPRGRRRKGPASAVTPVFSESSAMERSSVRRVAAGSSSSRPLTFRRTLLRAQLRALAQHFFEKRHRAAHLGARARAVFVEKV